MAFRFAGRNPRRGATWTGALLGLVTFVTVLGGAVAVDWSEGRRLRSARDARLDSELGHLSREILRDLDVAVGELRSLAFWVGAEPDVVVPNFERYSHGLIERHKTLRSTTLLEGDVITATFPPNAALLGMDVGHHSVQGEAVAEMRALGDALVTGPVSLAQGGVGLIIRAPVWMGDNATPESYWGHVSMVIDAGRLEAILRKYSELFRVSVVLTDLDGRGTTSALRLGSSGVFTEASHLLDFGVPGERWRLTASAVDYVREFPSSWLGMLVGAVMAVCSGIGVWMLVVTSSALRSKNEQLEQLAMTDALTRVHNRRFVLSLCQEHLDRHASGGPAFSLLLLDLDHFKNINDEYGHAAGDDVLRGVVAVLQQGVRGADAIGRWGGEEFVVLAPDTDKRGAFELAERLRTAINNVVISTSRTALRVTASFGVATCEQGETCAHLLERADRALYLAKSKGRNRSEAAKGSRSEMRAVGATF